MGQATSFPFEVLEPTQSSCATRNSQTYWALFTGRRKADGAEVSIHKLDKINTLKLKVEAGMHGFQKMKTMRHPYILQYLDGVDLEKELVLVTEPVIPLVEWLATLKPEFREEQVAWGLRCLAAALEFLTGSPHHMTHGMVCSHNVFVTKAGDWKLGGLDLLCEWRQGGKDVFHFQLHEALVPPEYRAPERRNNNMDLMLRSVPGALDVWALGVLIGNVVELTEGKAPSGPLASVHRRLLSENPKDRPSAGQILRHPYFSPKSSKGLIRILEFLENFSLKEDAEKLEFFNSLVPLVAQLPPEVGIYKILPTFRDYVHIGGGGGLATGGQAPDQASTKQGMGQRQLVLTALPVCLEILKGLNEATFTEMGEPLLVSLFGMNDRAVRAILLQNLQPLATKLSEANINGLLFDSVLTGFADSAPQLRELTLKSMLCFSHRLNDKNLNDRLMRCLTKLQIDPEPSIRTNTTIFLGRIASHLNDGSRSRVLLPSFLKACRDPFPHARLAGLKSAAACTAYFDALSVATKVLPIVATLLIDVDGLVRDAAFQCHDAFMKVLQVNAQRLKEIEGDRRKEILEKQGIGEVQRLEGLPSSVFGAGAASLGGLTSSVAAWGAQKMWMSSSMLVGSESGDVNTPSGGLSLGPKEEENFFDSLAPPSSGSRVAAASSDGWDDDMGEDDGNGWGKDRDHDVVGEIEAAGLKSSFSGSTSARGRGEGVFLSVSSRAGGLAASVVEKLTPATPESSLTSQNLGNKNRTTTRADFTKPITEDDLFSMLTDTNAAPSAFHRTTAANLQVPPPASVKATIASPMSSSQSDLGTKRMTGTGRPRLQAKKLEVSKASDLWDDF